MQAGRQCHGQVQAIVTHRKTSHPLFITIVLESIDAQKLCDRDNLPETVITNDGGTKMRWRSGKAKKPYL